MTKIKQSPKLPAEERREQLLMAAQELFLKKGYRDTTTDEIARAAGLTKGAFYFHFKSKEDMLVELVRHVGETHKAEYTEQTWHKLTPARIIENAIESKAHRVHRKFHHNMDLLVQALAIPKVRRHLNKLYGEILELAAEHLDPKFGSIERRRQLAAMSFCLFDGLLIRKAIDPSTVHMSAQIRLIRALTEDSPESEPRKKRKI